MTSFDFDSFRFDGATRILRNSGQEVSIAPKVADLLLLFLEAPQKLFSKEELKRQGWPDVEFVEDNNLFYHLSALRDALGRRPDGGRYIETLPKRGYRFVAPVLKVGPEVNRAASETPSPAAEVHPAGAAVASSFVPQTSRIRLSRRRLPILLAVVVLIVIASVLAFRLAPVPRLFVAGYAPLTHDGLEKIDGLLLTDGPRVYFGERGQDGLSFRAVSSGGGAAATVHLPSGFPTVYDLSASTSEVLAAPMRADDGKGSDLWAVSLLGGSPRRIGEIRVDDATWSPDAKQIAYGLGHDLYIVAADGNNRRKVSESSGMVQSLRWSPDGRRLSFTEAWRRGDEIMHSLWEVQADGSDLRRLLDGWNPHPQECCSMWTTDGRSFIFQSTREDRTDLWALRVRRDFLVRDDRPPVRLTSGLQSYSFPAASPDPRKLFAIGTERRGELVRYDSGSKQFVPFLGGVSATWVLFSPSGKSVVYIRYPDLTIWRSKPDGSEKTQVTFAPFKADGLSWSPDERWLAVRGRANDELWKIYLVPARGGEAKILVPSEKEQGVPAWSPDGRQIAFGDVPPVHDKSSGGEAIHIFDLGNRSLSDLPGSQGLWTSRWSPNGRYLSAVTIEGGRLMLYDFATKKWRTTQASKVNNPTWTQDCKFIYFDTEWPVRTLDRVRVADGRLDQLVDLKPYRTLSWWWSGAAPDGSPLILRDIGSSEIYSLLLESR